MRVLTVLAVCLSLLPVQRVLAQAPSGDWVSYRDAYRAMVAFEKYGGPKALLTQQLQVLPQALPRAGEGDALALAVSGRHTLLNFPLDPTLRTVFPLTKSAYDENALLQLTRALGPFTVRPQVSLALRADNLYDSEELRRGCEQALAYARQMALIGANRCAGVRFVFDKGVRGSALRVRGTTDTGLAAVPGAPFAGDLDAGFPIVTYRFARNEHVHLGAASVPLAITPLFE